MLTRPDLAVAECFALVALVTVAEAQVPLSQPRVPAPASRSGAPTAEFTAEPRSLRSRFEWVGGRPPIAFRPFDTLDAQGRRLPLDSLITFRFPSGRTARPMTLRDVHFFANQLERDLNAHGVSLRRLDSSTVLMRPRTNAALLRRQRQRFEAMPRPAPPSDLRPAVERMQRLQQRIAAPPAQLAQVDPRMARLAATAAPVRARPVAARASGVSPAVDAMVDQFAEVTQSTMVADTTLRWDGSYGDGASASVGAGVTLVSSLEAAEIAFSFNAGITFLDDQKSLITLDATFLSGRDGPHSATLTWRLLGNITEILETPIVPEGTVNRFGQPSPTGFYRSYAVAPRTDTYSIDFPIPLVPVDVDLSLTTSASFATAMAVGPAALSGWVSTTAYARVDAEVSLSFDVPPVEIGAEGSLMLVSTNLYADLENIVRVSGTPSCTAVMICNRADYGAFRFVGANLADGRALEGRITFYADVYLPCLDLPPWCWTRLPTVDLSWPPVNFSNPGLFVLNDMALVAQNVETSPPAVQQVGPARQP